LGGELFIHQLRIDSTSQAGWRKGIGPKGLEKYFSWTLDTIKGVDCFSFKNVDHDSVYYFDEI
jgi:hypothetical protein